MILFTISQMGFISEPPTPSTQFAPISTDNPAKFVLWMRPPILSVASSINIFFIPASDNVFAADIPAFAHSTLHSRRCMKELINLDFHRFSHSTIKDEIQDSKVISISPDMPAPTTITVGTFAAAWAILKKLRTTAITASREATILVSLLFTISCLLSPSSTSTLGILQLRLHSYLWTE